MNFEALIRKLTHTFINRVTVSGNAIVRAPLDNMVSRDNMWKYWYNTLFILSNIVATLSIDVVSIISYIIMYLSILSDC